MTDNLMAVVVKHFLNELEEHIKPENITLESNLRDDLGLDSLQAVSIIMNIEDEFDISVSEDELTNVQTVGDVVGILRKKLEEKEGS